MDVFDALTSTRSYRSALGREAALEELKRCRHSWRRDVYEAFMASVGSPTWERSLSAGA